MFRKANNPRLSHLIHRASAAAGLALILASPALAMDSAIPQSGECDWPTAVKAGYYCTGAFVGNQIVVTAAHCIEDGNLPGGKVYFGETPQEEFEIPVVRCERHPAGEFSTNIWGEKSYDGVDLAYCELQWNSNMQRVPVLVDECEGDYVRHKLFQEMGATEVTSIGMGCDSVQCNFPGYKRDAVFHLEGQRYTKGSWKLEAEFPGEDSPLHSGDSGGPLMFEMADGTWRVIGVYHGISGGDVWERVPPYVRWIETDSGRDITPCYDWDAGEGKYVFDGDAESCSEVGHAAYPDNGGGAHWPFCSAGEKSQVDECSGWDEPVPHPGYAVTPGGTGGNDIIDIIGVRPYNQARGGRGNDFINGSLKNDLIMPGSGFDDVNAEAGDDTVVFFDVCEIERGGKVNGGRGNDTLILPVPAAIAQELGLEIVDFETIVVDTRRTAEADCTPDPGALRLPKEPTGASTPTPSADTSGPVHFDQR